MSIKVNGGKNPTAIKFIRNGTTTNLTEVWYKSSPSATAVMVWPEMKSIRINPDYQFAINGHNYEPFDMVYKFSPNEDQEIILYNYSSTGMGGSLRYYNKKGVDSYVATNRGSGNTKIYLCWDSAGGYWYAYSQSNPSSFTKLSDGVEYLHVGGGSGANHWCEAID